MEATPTVPVVGNDDAPTPPDTDTDYWWSLITEKAAAAFQGVTERKMQKDRQTGGGPKYIRLSSRCIRYRRIDLRADAEARMRCSTSDPGAEAIA